MFRNLNPEDYNLVLELDKKVYPTNSPVTAENLAAWYSKNPEFGRIEEEDGKVTGLYVAIPLKMVPWYQLTRGPAIGGKKLAESDIQTEHLFDGSGPMGIHIYHIEKFTEEKGFYQKAFTDLGESFKKLKEQNSRTRLSGLSALCVTPAGIGLFEKLGFRIVPENIPEMIYQRDGDIKLTTNIEEVEAAIKEGYRLRNACEMMVTIFPGENKQTKVWKYFS